MGPVGRAGLDAGEMGMVEMVVVMGEMMVEEHDVVEEDNLEVPTLAVPPCPPAEAAHAHHALSCGH